MAKRKLCELMVSRGLASSLKEAQAMVMAGQVVVADRRADKAGDLVSDDTRIRLKSKSKYVSRAGDKLESAIKAFSLEDALKGCVCLDVGSSTGGFTDCLLRFGVKAVFAVDVGTNQLDWKLRSLDNVIVSEKTDFRNYEYPESTYQTPAKFIVADVSFISLTSLVEAFYHVSGPETELVLMVKPQFEVPKAEVPEGGIIEDPTQIKAAVDRVKDSFCKQGFVVKGVAESAVKGRFGNLEVFLYLGVVPK